jgi:hypothetical protein
VVLKFAPKRARDVPLFVARLPIFSRAYYSTHNFEETTLDRRSARALQGRRFEPAATSNTTA